MTALPSLEEAARLLPHQGPIGVFVHQNTLEALEHLPFHEALAQAAVQLGARVRLDESALRAMLADGRIDDTDLRAVFDAEPARWPDPVAPGLPPAREIAWRVLVDGLVDVHWRVRAFEVSVGRPDPVVATLDPARRAVLAEGTRRLLARDPEGSVRVLAGSDDPELVAQRLRQQLGLEDQGECVRVAMEVPGRAEELGLALLSGFGRRGLEQRTKGPEATDTAWLERQVDEILLPLIAARLDQGTASLRNHGTTLFEDGVLLLRSRRRLWRSVEGLIDKTPEATLARALGAVGLDEQGVLRRLLSARPGWAGAVRFREHHSGDTTLVEYAALRLVTRIGCAKAAGVPHEAGLEAPAPPAAGPGTRADRVAQVLILAGVGPDRASLLEPEHWSRLEALTEATASAWRCRLLQDARDRSAAKRWLTAVARSEPSVPLQPDYQVICCIDDREESFRRALEECGGASVETVGLAGFFNLALAYRRAGDRHDAASHPVNLSSSNRVAERADPPDPLRRTLGKVGWITDRGGAGLASGMLTALGFGLLAALLLIYRVFAPLGSARTLDRWLARWAPAPVASIDPWAEGPTEGLPQGYTIEQAAERVAGALQPLGIAGRLARVVLVVGHGSSSVNNPHASAYDCGACGGHRGDANARIFAELANRPEVRTELAKRGLQVPPGTLFVGAFHDTASDEVRLWWPEALSEADRAALRALVDAAAARDARERGRRFFSLSGAVHEAAALEHARHRAVDLAQVRPELGHATNALLVVGPRARTRGLFLDRRAFLQSYDADTDPAGEALTRLLDATIPVCAGINLEYYFSRVDSERFGAGTKLPHNVIGLHGVMAGSLGDLRTGLPWQMVELHEPTRLLVLVCAPRARVQEVVARLPRAQRLVTGAWIHLAALDAEGAWMWRDGAWVSEPIPPESLPEAPGSVAWFASRRDDLPVARVAR